MEHALHVEPEFTAHVLHVTLPVYCLYVPVVQAVHGPPFGPEYAMLQVHELSVAQPIHEAPEFVGHADAGPPLGP